MSHYFSEEPSAASAPVPVRLLLPDGTLDLVSDTGVFSKGEVDAGTKLLLLEAPPLDTVAAGGAHLLDLGCGYGPIALTMARRAPEATVWAVDVNRRAVELTAANAASCGLTNVRACHPDEVPDDLTFAAIWSNPPIRIGKAALHELLLRWLRRLIPGGSALLVVQKHLGSDSLARWLGSQGFPTTRRSSRAGFRLLEVTTS